MPGVIARLEWLHCRRPDILMRQEAESVFRVQGSGVRVEGRGSRVDG